MSAYNGHILDTIGMLANATLRVLSSSSCSGAATRQCVTGPRLLRELKATRQSGYTGWLELDPMGDRLGRYVVKQVVMSGSPGKMAFVDVAEFDSLTNESRLLRDVSWAHMNRSFQGTPQSVCSEPCQGNEAMQMMKRQCCWQCILCNENEKRTPQGCVRCPMFMWPDPKNGSSTCEQIPIVVAHWGTKVWIVNILISTIGLVLCFIAAVCYCRFRHTAIIHNSPLGLSLFTLSGVAMGFCALLVDLSYPTEASCRISNMLVDLSFATLYGSLLVRCVCNYRIFDAFLTNAPPPQFTGARHQLIFALGLLLVQVRSCSMWLDIIREA